MPLDIYNKDFQNWLKGVLALNTTREALCETMMGGFKHFISKLPQSEKSHLRQFLSCLKVKKVPPLKQLKHLKQPTKYECRHGKCKTLFDKFLEQHTEKGKLNLEWDVSHHEVDTNESESTTTVDDVIVWEFLRLYMIADKGEHATKCQRLDDLDISNVIIIMKSCKLFYPDGSLELYDKVTNFRNELMHSASNKVSEDNLKQNVGKAIELIKLLTNQSQTEATKYLQKIGEKNFDISFQSEEYKRVLVEVKQAEIIAENLQTDERSRADLKTLQETLKRIIGSEPDDISKQFVGKASAFKELVKKCIEKKQKSIKLDKATCSLGDDTAHKAAELEKLLQQVEQDLIEINEELKKTEEEDLTNLLKCFREENTILKKERDKEYRKNRSLRRDIRELESKEELTKTEVEDLTNLLESLREENTTLKTERDKAFQDNDDLNRKNESLRRDIRDLESKEEQKKTEEEDLANLLECLREENTTLKTERDKAFQDNADLNRKNESLKRDIRYLESKEKRKKTEEEDPVNLFKYFLRDNSKTERDKAFQNNADVSEKSESLRRDIRYIESKEERKKTEEEDPVNVFKYFWRDNTKTERDKAFQNNADVNRKSESLRRDIRDLESKRMEDFNSFLHNTRKDEENILANNQLMSEKENEEELRKRDAIADQKLKESQDLMSKELEKLNLDNEEYVRRITEKQRQKEEANTKMHMNAILEARSKEDAYLEELRRQHERFQAESRHGILAKAWDFFFRT